MLTTSGLFLEEAKALFLMSKHHLSWNWLKATPRNWGDNLPSNAPEPQGISQPTMLNSFTVKTSRLIVKEKLTLIFFGSMLFWVLVRTYKFVSKPVRCVFDNSHTQKRPFVYQSTVWGIRICLIILIYHLCMDPKRDLFWPLPMGPGRWPWAPRMPTLIQVSAWWPCPPS